MFNAYVPKITLPAGKSDIRKGGGIGIICEGQVMLVDGFEGGEPTNGLKDWLAENGVSTVNTAVLTHVHYDHYHGLLEIEEDPRFHIELVLMYDPLTLKHGCDGSANGRAVKEDMDNAYKFIRKMQSHGTKVRWIDKGASFTLGDASFKVFRDQPREFTDLDDGNAYAFVNDGSLVLWSPETQILLGGDGCGNIKDAISYFGARVSGYDIAHHGNSCTKSNAEALKRAGCVVAWETCVERNGAGTTEWTEYGARRVREQGIPVYMQDAPIYITASDGRITFKQGNISISKYVLYGSIGEWVRNVKGWWFRLANGGYAVGWLKINGKWYFFDEDGYMVTGWRKVNGKWYYLDGSGAMKTGWIYLNGVWYYLEESGAMHTGWLDWKGKRCYLEPSGHCLVNCVKTIDGVTYRFDKGGYATEISARSTLNGVDVASYQSGINPSKMDTTDFAIVKFTQGTSYLNPYAEKQYSSFKAAVKLLGAYHYASGKDAKSEAQYFVKALGDRVGECILALDWEGNQNSVFGSGKDVSWCKAFLDEVYRLTGVNALIYMSKSVCRKHDWSPIAPDHPLWCAQYKTNSTTDYQSNPWTDSNSFGAWQTDTIRQYSSHGRIAGYDSNIDINLAYLSVDQWKALASGKPQESPVDVAIGIAESYVGYHEGANNSTIFGDTMHSIQPSNMDKDAPWCDAFVDFVILQMCRHFGFMETTAKKVLCGNFDDYTYNSVNLYKKAGRWSNTPHRGDQIFFGGSGHTGIVTSVESGTVHTIEGNKGDEVRRGSYSVNSPSIIGYGRPRYDLITGQVTAEDMPYIKRGSRSDAVKKLQELLNVKGYKLSVDGDFGPATEAAVKAYQAANHLTVDGEVGEKTWGSLMN